ncbi:MAG TPA: 30S ribosomal protein S26e [Candidatus Bathyarchaeia archaeon]|nr:30S ribosomal protein S26e [Candidatus Bathyarchaeia archaeon]HXL50446.1 30S ribosomal protein S26e [Candidatus Limnocylindrales bacterium]HYU55607.1 30S ribosomal protein S26e [Candidatus Dormibacteraeota bacterium]
MPKKRRSRGRSKGGKGRSELVQCSNCGMLSPRDKMKRVTSWVSLVEPTLAKELRARGAYIARQRVMKNLCVSCAVHFGVSKVRSADERRGPQHFSQSSR